MNSRILLIAFATISYLGVTNSAGLNPQPKDSVEAHIVPSTPSTVPSHAANHSSIDAVSQVPPQIPQKNATPPATQVPQTNSTPQVIQSNLTDVKIEIHNTTTVTTTTVKPNEPNVTITSTPPTTKSTTAKPTSTTLLPNSTSTTEKPNTSPSQTGSTSAFEPTTSSNIPGRGRQFDGPSFIGGIVLTVGLTAIGFIAFKFYKAGKLDMSYRTL